MKIILSWGQTILFCTVLKEYLILILFSYTTLAKFNSRSLLTWLKLHVTVLAGRMFFLLRFTFNKVTVMQSLPASNPALKSFAPRCAGCVQTLFHGFLEVHTAHQSFHSEELHLLICVTNQHTFIFSGCTFLESHCHWVNVAQRTNMYLHPQHQVRTLLLSLACRASSHCSHWCWT